MAKVIQRIADDGKYIYVHFTCVEVVFFPAGTPFRYIQRVLIGAVENYLFICLKDIRKLVKCIILLIYRCTINLKLRQINLFLKNDLISSH